VDILTEVDLRERLNRLLIWSTRYEKPSEVYEEMREQVEEALAVPDPTVEIEEHPQKRWLRER
jgi:hypothetical protein